LGTTRIGTKSETSRGARSMDTLSVVAFTLSERGGGRCRTRRGATTWPPIPRGSALDRHDNDVAEDEATDKDEGRRDGAKRAHATAEDVEQERHDESRSDEAAPEQRPQVAAGDRLRRRAQHAEQDREHVA